MHWSEDGEPDAESDCLPPAWKRWRDTALAVRERSPLVSARSTEVAFFSTLLKEKKDKYVSRLVVKSL